MNGFDTRHVKKCKYKKETEKERKRIYSASALWVRLCQARVPEVHPTFWPKITTSGGVSYDVAGQRLGNSQFNENWKPFVERKHKQEGKNTQTNENKDYGKLLLLSIEETCSKRNLTQTSNHWLSFSVTLNTEESTAKAEWSQKIMFFCRFLKKKQKHLDQGFEILDYWIPPTHYFYIKEHKWIQGLTFPSFPIQAVKMMQM